MYKIRGFLPTGKSIRKYCGLLHISENIISAFAYFIMRWNKTLIYSAGTLLVCATKIHDFCLILD